MLSHDKRTLVASLNWTRTPRPAAPGRALTEPRGGLEHGDPQAALGQPKGAGVADDARADHDHVAPSRRKASGGKARARKARHLSPNGFSQMSSVAHLSEAASSLC